MRAKHPATGERRLIHRPPKAAHAALCAVAILIVAATSGALAQEAPWPVRLHRDMARVLAAEWRLREAAGGLCPASAADIGILFDDRRAYAKPDWPLLQSTVNLGERPRVVAVAPGSPAHTAGIVAGDEVESIDGLTVDAIATRRKAGALVAEALLAEIAEHTADQPLVVGVRRNGLVQVIPVRPVLHCSARLVLVTNPAVDAYSDRHNVAITTGLVTFARSDDELALAAGHELAHIIHRDRKGGGIALRRRMEDAADLVGLGLLHCAGYQAGTGIALFQRLGKRDWLGFLRAPTHRSFAKRVERLQDAQARLSCPVQPAPAHGT